MDNTKGFSVDLKLYEGNDRNTLNIFANRAGFVQPNAFVDQKDFVLDVGNSLEVSDTETTLCFVLYASRPIRVLATIGIATTQTTFENQTVMVISDAVSIFI